MNIKEYKNQLKLELNEYKDKLKEKLNEYKEKLNLKLKKFKEREDKKKSKKSKKTTKKGGHIRRITQSNSPITKNQDDEDDKDYEVKDDNNCDQLYDNFMDSLKTMDQMSLDDFLDLLNNINKQLKENNCNKKIKLLNIFEHLGKNINDDGNDDNYLKLLSTSRGDDDSRPDGVGIKLDKLKELLKLEEFKKLQEELEELQISNDLNIKKGLDYFLDRIIKNN